MLVGLTDNINALMKYFETMNVTINVMITEHDTQLKSIAEDRANGVKLEKAELEVRGFAASNFTQEKLIRGPGFPQECSHLQARGVGNTRAFKLIRKGHHGSYQPRVFADCRLLTPHGR